MEKKKNILSKILFVFECAMCRVQYTSSSEQDKKLCPTCDIAGENKSLSNEKHKSKSINSNNKKNKI